MAEFLDADELAFLETDSCTECGEHLDNCECGDICIFDHTGAELMDEDDGMEFWWCHDCGAEWQEEVDEA